MTLERTTLSSRRLAAVGGAAGAIVLVVVLAASPASAPSAADEPQAAGPGSWEPGAQPRPTRAPSVAPEPAGDPGGSPPPATPPPEPAIDHGIPVAEDPIEESPLEMQQAAALQVAADFAAAYGQHHFDDGPSATLDRVRPFVSDELAAELASSSGASAALRERAALRETATATVQAVQHQAGSVEEGWMDLLVVIRQEVTSQAGSESRWPTFLVQVRPSDGVWRVSRLLP